LVVDELPTVEEPDVLLPVVLPACAIAMPKANVSTTVRINKRVLIAIVLSRIDFSCTEVGWVPLAAGCTARVAGVAKSSAAAQRAA
jgi:hypothetical protein